MPWLIIRLFNKLGFLPYINTYFTLKIEDKKVMIPVMGNLRLLSLSEPWMTNVLYALKHSFGGTFIDIGVNLGQTLVKAYTVFNQINYVGFEPNPGCVYYIKELIKLNQFHNCCILPVGVSNETNIMSLHFFYDDDSDSTASILDKFRPGQPINHSINIPVFNPQYLHKFLPAASNSILKIDVEGAELEVLLGFEDWIVSNQPNIIIEILPVYDADNTYRLKRQQQIEDLLLKWNYGIFRIGKNIPVTVKKIEAIGIHGRIEDCDYILCPLSKIDQITSYFANQ